MRGEEAAVSSRSPDYSLMGLLFTSVMWSAYKTKLLVPVLESVSRAIATVRSGGSSHQNKRKKLF